MEIGRDLERHDPQPIEGAIGAAVLYAGPHESRGPARHAGERHGGRRATGEIGAGLVVLLGVTHDDTAETARRLAAKIHTLRILRDEQSVAEPGAGVLVVSQFTLYGDARKGRRPTWNAAAPGDIAEPIYDVFCAHPARSGRHRRRGRLRRAHGDRAHERRPDDARPRLLKESSGWQTRLLRAPWEDCALCQRPP